MNTDEPDDGLALTCWFVSAWMVVMTFGFWKAWGLWT